jgi:predicted nucleic acid-binding Zn ribbon protein
MHQSTSSRLSPIASIDSRNSSDERRTLYAPHQNVVSSSTPIPANALAINAEIAGEVERRREKRRKQIINVSIVILGIVMIAL